MTDLAGPLGVSELMEQGLEFLTEDLRAERALVLYEGRGVARGLDPKTVWTVGEVSQELIRDIERLLEIQWI